MQMRELRASVQCRVFTGLEESHLANSTAKCDPGMDFLVTFYFHASQMVVDSMKDFAVTVCKLENA